MKLAALLIAFVFGVVLLSTASLAAHPSGQDLSLGWKVIKNFHDEASGNDQFLAELTITNQSSTPLGGEGWRLYFCSLRKFEPDDTGGSVKITRVNGDLFWLRPQPSFKLIEPGQSQSFVVTGAGSAVKECELPTGHYFVFYDAQGNQQSISAMIEAKISPFESKQQTARSASDLVPVPTAASRYEENSQLSKLPADQVDLVLPTPKKMTRLPGEVVLDTTATIYCEAGLESEARLLAIQLSTLLGKTIAVSKETEPPSAIRLLHGTHLAGEAYTLTSNPDRGVEILGGGRAGVFYGVQSLLSLLPAEAFRQSQATLTLPAVQIEDAPRFRYRGLLVDVARNFHSKKSIEKLLDQMAFYKLNRLHLHLSDDEGWRVEIQAIPELTTVGARRGHTSDESDCLMPSYGSGPVPDQAPGSGFYTQAEFVDILRYAAERHVVVIPEFDFPGHARAAIRATESRRKRLLAAGKPEQADEFALIDPNDRSEYESVQYWNDNVVDLGLESTFHFLETVVGEIAGLYEQAGVPLQTFHVGGDEVPHGVWQKSPACLALVESGKVASLDQTVLQDYFFLRMLEIFERHNLRMAGWEEVLLAPGEEGGKVPNQDFLQKPVAGYVWNNVWGWGQEDFAYRLANAGFEIVLCNATNLYFDLAHDKHPQEPGHGWAGYTGLKKPYEFAPFDFYQNASHNKMGSPIPPEQFADSLRLTPAGKTKILGIQAQLFSEYVRSPERLEYMAFPRAIALAERAWAKQPDWATTKDLQQRAEQLNAAWNRFANTLGQHTLPRIDFLGDGTNYWLPLPGAKMKNGQLHANVALPGLEIRYTTDGSEPTANSTRYERPVSVDRPVKLRTFDQRGRGSRTVKCKK